jgi:hypothetical protein
VEGLSTFTTRDEFHSIIFSPDIQSMTWGFYNGSVKIWHIETCEETVSFKNYAEIKQLLLENRAGYVTAQ